jgi:hypothetical protein
VPYGYVDRHNEMFEIKYKDELSFLKENIEQTIDVHQSKIYIEMNQSRPVPWSFSHKKTQVPLNRPKFIFSCRTR